MYDTGSGVHFTDLQRTFLAFVTLERQRIDALRTRALCWASMSSIYEDKSAGMENAQLALKAFFKELDRVVGDDNKRDDEMKRLVADYSSKAFIINRR